MIGLLGVLRGARGRGALKEATFHGSRGSAVPVRVRMRRVRLFGFKCER